MDFMEFFTAIVPSFVILVTGLVKYINKRLSSCEKERKLLADRVSALENTMIGDFPKWTHNNQGIILSVNKEFIAYIAVKCDKTYEDFIGKSIYDLEFICPLAKRQIQAMISSVRDKKYCIEHGIEIISGHKVTMTKTIIMAGNDILFVCYLIPEDF